MASLRRAAELPTLFKKPISVLEFCDRQNHDSAERSVWEWKLGRIRFFFEGGTPEDQENKALSILLGAESAAELLFLVRNLGWGDLDDELDENDIDVLANRLSRLIDLDGYLPVRYLGRFSDGPWRSDIPDDEKVVPIDELDADIAATLPFYSGDVGAQLVADLLDDEDRTLAQIAVHALRAQTTFAIEFRRLLDALAATGVTDAGQLTATAWRVHYTDRLCRNLERAEFDVLTGMLPQMVDPALPIDQRTALFDMVRRWDSRLRAVEQALDLVGEAHQRVGIRRFRSTVDVFVANFPATTAPTGPPPGIFGGIAQQLGLIANSFDELAAAVGDLGVELGDALNEAFSFLDDMEDDDTNSLVANLSGAHLLAVLPTAVKGQLIDNLLDGSTVNADEQSILLLLGASLEGTPPFSTAEFLQLIVGRYEKLDFSLDHTEHDQFEEQLAQV